MARRTIAFALSLCIFVGVAAVAGLTLRLLYRTAGLARNIRAARSVRSAVVSDSRILTPEWYGEADAARISQILSDDRPILLVVTNDGCLHCMTAVERWTSALAGAPAVRGRLHVLVVTPSFGDNTATPLARIRRAGIDVGIVHIRDLPSFRIASGIQSVPMSLMFLHRGYIAATIGGVPSPAAVQTVLQMIGSHSVGRHLFVEHNPTSARLR